MSVRFQGDRYIRIVRREIRVIVGEVTFFVVSFVGVVVRFVRQSDVESGGDVNWE